MMAAKPKSSSTVVPRTRVAPHVMSSVKTSEEAVEDLERRLLAIGGGGAPAPAVTASIAAPAMSSSVAKTTTTEPKGGKNALLARIMAAQERAKIAQQKQKATEEQFSAMSDQERMMKALSGEVAQEPKPAASSIDLPPPFEVAADVAAPPPFEAAEKQHMKPVLPPPSFEAAFIPPPVQTSSHSKPADMAPPPFEMLEPALPPPLSAPIVTTPSAPPVDFLDTSSQPVVPPPSMHAVNLDGIERIVPPPASAAAPAPVASAPPSFDQIEQNGSSAAEDPSAFDFDIDGMQMTPEERKLMMEEQRQILDQIQKESADNAAAIAAAAAEGFESRSGTAAAAAVPPAMEMPSSASAMSPPPFEAISEPPVSTTGGKRANRTVEIGGGHQVALHGQERTKAAIAAGTAILVQCINCENWMQVTESATLMFCPVCNIVCPVQKQSQVVTKDEAIQLTNDRKLAEQLQKEFDEQSRPQRPRQQQQQQQKNQSGSWWDAFSSLVSFGVTPAEEQRTSNITRTEEETGPSTNSSPGQLHSVQIGEESSAATSSNVEREGLLGNESARGSFPSARVADKQPLFSCVVDSMSNAATAFGTSLTARTLDEDAEGNVHGVDSSSLLVTQVGREGGERGGGSYRSASNWE